MYIGYACMPKVHMHIRSAYSICTCLSRPVWPRRVEIRIPARGEGSQDPWRGLTMVPQGRHRGTLNSVIPKGFLQWPIRREKGEARDGERGEGGSGGARESAAGGEEGVVPLIQVYQDLLLYKHILQYNTIQTCTTLQCMLLHQNMLPWSMV